MCSLATDDRSKLMLTGARIQAESDPGFVTSWAMGDGSIVDLNATMIIAISNAVLTHVQASFATFKTVATAIEAGTISSPAEIDAADWPS